MTIDTIIGNFFLIMLVAYVVFAIHFIAQARRGNPMAFVALAAGGFAGKYQLLIFGFTVLCSVGFYSFGMEYTALINLLSIIPCAVVANVGLYFRNRPQLLTKWSAS